MPRFGVINERRHQLHEVIRLSGMNLIVNDYDHPLIIKVASIPQIRIQVYFIDNEEYFKKVKIGFNTMPPATRSNSTSDIYNTILSFPYFRDFLDLQVVYDNQALYDICNEQLQIETIGFP